MTGFASGTVRVVSARICFSTARACGGTDRRYSSIVATLGRFAIVTNQRRGAATSCSQVTVSLASRDQRQIHTDGILHRRIRGFPILAFSRLDHGAAFFLYATKAFAEVAHRQ